MLVLSNIVKDYVAGDTTVRALDNVNIAFRKSEFVSILGHSGCGKTTLLNIIGGLDRYTEGDLKIKGVSTKLYKDHDWDAYRNHSIGFVFQSYNLIPHQTVMANVELSLTLTGVSKAERRKRAEEVLKRVGLESQMYKKPSQMSGGQMQRVAIARALINDPEILLADEPTGALDTETSVQIMDILKDISKDRLIIMVTHNPELAEKYSDRIIRLSDGKVVGDTNPYSADEEEKEFVSAASVTEEKTEETLKSKKKRPSMSFLTALSLSLNNLMTKKTRTFMTSFAGSIGIIGIALILSLSNGINAYIAKVQRETLSSYPITLQKEEIDIGGVITSLMGKREEDIKSREEDKIYSSTVMYDLMTTMMNPEMNSNNLKKFKTFLESGESKIPDYTVLIRYGYDVDVNAYLQDSEGKYFKADVMALYAEMASNMGMNMSSSDSSSSSMYSMSQGNSGYNIWDEMLPPAEKGDGVIHEMVKEQYDVIAGRWPENKQEIVLVVSQNNEISDMALYSLGLVSSDEMYDAMIAAFKGEAPEETEPLCFSYDELLGIKYKLIPTCDYYYQNEDGEWINASLTEDQTQMNSKIAEGLDLEIVGIIRQNKDATSGSISGSLGYTSELTDYIITLTENSEIIKAQMENDKTDVFTGLPFVLDESDKLSDAEKPEAFKAYLDTLSVLKKAELYSKILTTPSDEYVSATVEAYLGFMGINEESEKEDLKTAVLSQMNDTDPELLEKYFDSFDRDQLYAFIVSMMEEMVKTDYADKAQKLISDIENAPSEAELDAESSLIIIESIPAASQKAVLKMLMKDNAAMVDTMPDVQVRQTLETLIRAYGQTSGESQNMADMLIVMTDADARKAFVADIYKSSTQLSETVIDEEIDKLSATELNAVFKTEVGKLAKENYLVMTAPTQSAAAKNAKLAMAFDKEAATYPDELMVKYYDEYVPTVSESSLNDNLKVLGYADKDDPTSISIYAKNFEDKEMITDLIGEYNASQENEDDTIGYTDYIGLLMSSVTRIVNGISYVLIFFVSISLVVSSIMIGIITYISVLERTKEIGILRAMGASKKDISRVFNAETLIVGFVSGLIGITVTLLLNIPIAIIIRALSDISGIAVLPFWGAIALVLISMGLTLIAGLIPSGFAAKRDPVESLRSE